MPETVQRAETDSPCPASAIGKTAVLRHDFWHAAYLTMLADFTPEMILEYFSARPMELDGKVLGTADLCEHFRRGKGFVPINWNYAGLDSLESFLIGHGVEPLEFVRKLLFRNNRSTYVPGKIILSWFYPIMESVFKTYDPREMVFGLIAVFTETFHPNHIHRRFKKVVEGDWIHSYLLCASDRRFHDNRKFNFDLIAGEQLKAAPRVLDLPPFENVVYLSACHTLDEMVWAGDCTLMGTSIFLDGEVIGSRMRFSDFCRDRGLELGKFKVPDAEVFVALRDVACPIRRRTVIYGGCAYGAPCHITVIKHKKVGPSDRRYLKHLIADAMTEDGILAPELEKRHADLIARSRGIARFTWFEEDQSIDLNGQHLVKGVPAKILRNLIMAHVHDHRTGFEYREFKRDFEITYGRKNANFEVRFYRLIEKLKKECPFIWIEKTGRGKFSLRVNGRIEYRESATAYVQIGLSGASPVL